MEEKNIVARSFEGNRRDPRVDLLVASRMSRTSTSHRFFNMYSTTEFSDRCPFHSSLHRDLKPSNLLLNRSCDLKVNMTALIFLPSICVPSR